MVAANPKKLALDAAANVNLLGLLGVPPPKIAQYGKHIMEEFTTLNQVRNNIVVKRLKVRAHPKNEAYIQELEKAELALKEHSLNNAVKNGFTSSISNELVDNNTESMTGLQADVNKALEYLLLDDKGDNNIVARFIMRASKFGFDGEDFLTYIGNIAGSAKSGTELKTLMEGTRDRLKEIKSEEDVVSYMNQFVLTPNSEIVKTGLWVNEMIDTVGKETYYRHLIDIKKTHKEAIAMVNRAFPTYLEQLPIDMKILESYGITLFFSYWGRSPSVMREIARHKGASLGAELLIEDYYDLDLESPFSSNPYTRVTGYGGMTNNPGQFLGIDSIFATHLFG